MSEVKGRGLEIHHTADLLQTYSKERGHGHDKHSVALLEFTHKTIIFLPQAGRSHCICHVVTGQV